MPLNGSGGYAAPSNSWNPAVTGTAINSTDWAALLADLSTVLSTALYKDGQQTPTANLPMGGFRLTGLGAATSANDAIRAAQLQLDNICWAVAGGTADAITATYTPANAALVDGMFLRFRASAANATTTPTFAPDGLTAHTITKLGGTALVASDIAGNLYECLVRYNLTFTRWELLNPASSTPFSDSTALVKNAADATKLVKFDASGITTGTTRTLTVPNANGTLALVQAGGGQLVSETFYGIISASTVTMTIASPCVVTFASTQALSPGMPVVFTTSGTLPTGVVSGTTYYITGAISAVNPPTSNISATPNGAVINTSGSQSGTHTANNPTYNKATNNPTNVEMEMLGGGGGGGGVNATAGAAAGGGGGSSWVKCYTAASNIAAGAITLTVGAGGTAGTNAGGTGGTGGNTTAAIFTGGLSLTSGNASGGLGSTAASTPKAGGGGGFITYPSAINGNFLSSAGMNGNYSISTAAAATSYSGNGGNSMYGTGAIGNAGTSNAGSNANTINTTSNFGAGGGGALGASANVGGVGSSGLIIIREYS